MLAAILLLAIGQESVDFARDIQPLIEARCYECHALEYDGKRRKPKGKVRLDAPEFFLRGSGGERGVVVPGKPDQSALYARISLPADHEDVMPPEGEALGAKERDLIRRWIAGGADFGSWIGAVEAPATVTAPTVHEDAFAHYRTLGEGITPVSDSAIQKAAETSGARIEAVFPGSPLLRVEYLESPQRGTDKSLGALLALRRNVAVLVLTDAPITDSALTEIAKMPALVRLDLPRTKITDKGILAFARGAPPQLRRLNLFGTAVTDVAAKELGNLRGLEELYLWETKVTAKMAASLREALPSCRVHLERELPEPDAPRTPRNQRRKKN